MTKTDEGYVLVSKYEAEEGSGGSEPTVEPDAKPTSELVAESEPTAEPVAKSEPDVKSTVEPEPVAKPDKVSEKPKSKSKD
jgi:hypothetical protein